MNMLKKYPVSWENGMKLNKDVMQHQQCAIVQQILHTAGANLHPYKYGLFGNADDFDVTITNDQQFIVIRIHKIQSITLNGDLIVLNAAELPAEMIDHAAIFKIPFPAINAVGNYYLAINHHETNMLSYTYEWNDFAIAIPKFQINLIAFNLNESKQIPQHSFVIGSFSWNGQNITVNDHFIPSLMSVASHEDMLQWYISVLKVLEQIMQRSLQIVQKIRQKNQQNDLSKMVMDICLQVAQNLQTQLPSVRLVNGFVTPVKLYEVISSLALTLRFGLDQFINSGKEELMRYLTEWISYTPSVIDDSINEAAYLTVDTIDHNNNINQLSHFLTISTQLFETLEKLDFIGKKKDAGLFIKEEYITTSAPDVEAAAKPKRRFFGY